MEMFLFIYIIFKGYIPFTLSQNISNILHVMWYILASVSYFPLLNPYVAPLPSSLVGTCFFYLLLLGYTHEFIVFFRFHI